MYINAIIFVHIQEVNVMPKENAYKKMYFHLFNAMTDALRALEENHTDRAVHTLIAAQQWGEDAYLEIPDKDA